MDPRDPLASRYLQPSELSSSSSPPSSTEQLPLTEQRPLDHAGLNAECSRREEGS